MVPLTEAVATRESSPLGIRTQRDRGHCRPTLYALGTDAMQVKIGSSANEPGIIAYLLPNTSFENMLGSAIGCVILRHGCLCKFTQPNIIHVSHLEVILTNRLVS